MEENQEMLLEYEAKEAEIAAAKKQEAQKQDKPVLIDWIKGIKDGYDTYEKAKAFIVDKGNKLELGGKDLKEEVKAAIELAVQKGWDIDKITVKGPESLKEAWTKEVEAYKERSKIVDKETFQKAWEHATDGLEYGHDNDQIIKMNLERGIPEQATKDALALELLNRDMEINIPDKEIASMTHEKAKEYIESATSKVAEKIKESVMERGGEALKASIGIER